MRITTLFVVATVIALGGCDVKDQAPATAVSSAIAPILTSPDAVDTASFAKPLIARVTHVALDLDVDFQSKRVGGTATLDIERKPDAKEIILDDDGLEIASITDGAGGALAYKVGAGRPDMGAPLIIALKPDTKRIVVDYRSAPDGGALQWLSPDQTVGKKQPYLFSQGQSIFNRSWIPTQDSPGIRQTWAATIRVPAPLTAVMSAPRAAEPATVNGQRVFRFAMDKPVAPYLIAIAVGDLQFRSLGKNTGVWTEPAMLDAAAAELSDTQKMVDEAERLFGPYRWGRYDLLVLPPSFPYGGMENPTLTFLTPSFIAGDKSLVSLVAHELAHSWSGNLATNATWADGWLNEGMTTYAERRIVEVLYGPKVTAQQISLGLDAMNKAVAENGGPSGPDTRLRPELGTRHPDDVSSEIAYEKGSAMLRLIEQNVGRERFDAWFRHWFEVNAFKPVTTAMFLTDIRQNLINNDKALEAKLRLEDWLYKPGVPANLIPADPTAFADVDKSLATFVAGRAPDAAAWARFNTDERLRFLTHLPRALPADRLAALDHSLALGRSGNMEVRFAWLELAVANRFDPAVPGLEQFLGAIGRGKFVKPLYKALMADPWGRPIAERSYARSHSLYHSSVDRELKTYGLKS
ncbi:MAG: M1 family metallopeptidase [Sphingomicrobium sp.]